MVGKSEGWTMSQGVALCNCGLVTASALTYALTCLGPHRAITGLILPCLSTPSQRRHIMQLWDPWRSADGILGMVSKKVYHSRRPGSQCCSSPRSRLPALIVLTASNSWDLLFCRPESVVSACKAFGVSGAFSPVRAA